MSRHLKEFNLSLQRFRLNVFMLRNKTDALKNTLALICDSCVQR